jgi:putative FmdB family regulatory protein
MPIYEYQCQQCGTRSEALQKTADAPLTTCAACGGELKRLISSPAVQFKGSGWYVTDYARRSGGADKAGPKPEGKSDVGGESKGGETKGGETKRDGAAPAASDGKADKPASSSSAPAASGSTTKID